MNDKSSSKRIAIYWMIVDDHSESIILVIKLISLLTIKTDKQ